MENNLVNKRRYFAQYYGQKVFAVSKEAIAVQFVDNATLKKLDSLSALRLRTVNMITDKDIADFCDLMLDAKSKYPKFTILKVVRYITRFEVNFKWASPEVNNDDGWSYSAYGFYYANIRDVKAYQFLQSRGYFLPYLDLSTEMTLGYGWVTTDMPIKLSHKLR